jgi:hypothetical protein
MISSVFENIAAICPFRDFDSTFMDDAGHQLEYPAFVAAVH